MVHGLMIVRRYMLGRRRRPAPRSSASCTRTRESYRISWPAIRIRFASEPDLPRVSSRPTLTPLSVTVAERLIAKTEGCC